MITLAYIRVSGKGQVEGDGPDRQRDAILKYCEASGFSVPRQEFFEAAVSGTVEAMDRPQFSALLEVVDAAPDSRFRIVVERLDRLARDLMVSEFLLAECRKRKIEVYAADHPGQVDLASGEIDPTRTLLRQILGALAQWEKTALVMKLRKARDRKRVETGRCEGPRPFGTLPEEADGLRKMAKWHEAGSDYRTIASMANSHGWRTVAGKLWTKNAVYQVLKRRKFQVE